MKRAPSTCYYSGMAFIALVAALVLSCLTPSLSQPVTASSTEAANVGEGNTVFKFKLNFFASATGFFEVEGYEGVSPVLEMTVGQTYTFDQTQITNWYHPLGFAYYPDGALDDKPEIEDESLVYLINGVQPAENLDGYEPEFFFPREAWQEKNYTVQLTITPEIAAQAQGGEIFYFCHIHAGMSGRIKIVGAEPIGEAVPLPAVPEADAFDIECGTFETAAFAADASPNRCPGQTFLCGGENTRFAQCMHAIDCKMREEMRVNNEPSSPVATFMHQMIPHHENAVNMAKILLKESESLAVDEETEAMLYEIINGQNAQITYMRGWLKENDFASDHNDVYCEPPSQPQEVARVSTATSGATTMTAFSSGAAVALALVAAALNLLVGV
mmetsp:Transcript_27693/g.71275  ORF Transcript_27693/g.71275 Transcript_27693/m.71275 type:complete len:386 (+) Transcript_27693:191-1348(+)